MKNLSIALAFLIAPIASAHASDWQTVFQDSGKTIAVDAESFLRYGSKIKVWEEWSFSELQYGKFNHMKNLMMYDCAAFTAVTLKKTFYLNETLVHSDDGNGKQEDLIPDTMSDLVRKFVCTN